MDAGATGIMVPMIKCAADAKAAVDGVYYPPRGQRGVGLARAQGYGSSFQAYRQWLEENAVIVVMIEHVDAVREIDSILEVPGIDAYIIGPYDLSGSMGAPAISIIPMCRQLSHKCLKQAAVPANLAAFMLSNLIYRRCSNAFKRVLIFLGMDWISVFWIRFAALI